MSKKIAYKDLFCNRCKSVIKTGERIKMGFKGFIHYLCPDTPSLRELKAIQRSNKIKFRKDRNESLKQILKKSQEIINRS